MTNVIYSEFFGDKVNEVSNVCFAGVRYHEKNMPDIIRYWAVIQPELTLPMVEHYCSFVARLFAEDLFVYEIKFADPKPHVIWELKTKALNYISSLVRLTAFRYTDEFAKIVTDFAAERGSDEELFAAFQRIHIKGIKDGSAWQLSGHGLMYIYGVPDAYVPLSIDEFRARLQKPSVTVHAYFASAPVPKPAPKIVQYVAAPAPMPVPVAEPAKPAPKLKRAAKAIEALVPAPAPL